VGIITCSLFFKIARGLAGLRPEIEISSTKYTKPTFVGFKHRTVRFIPRRGDFVGFVAENLFSRPLPLGEGQGCGARVTGIVSKRHTM